MTKVSELAEGNFSFKRAFRVPLSYPTSEDKNSKLTVSPQNTQRQIRMKIASGFFFFIVLFFICAYNAWVISLPCPHPLPYHPLCPPFSPPPPQYPAETILPLSLLKKEYKQ
jgi:hypothetical protein